MSKMNEAVETLICDDDDDDHDDDDGWYSLVLHVWTEWPFLCFTKLFNCFSPASATVFPKTDPL